MTPDAFNACFELAAAGFLSLHVRRVWMDRSVAGVSLVAACFFASWTLFGFFYFASIGHWISFACSFPPMAMYLAWIVGLVRYRTRPSVDVPGCPPPGERPDAMCVACHRYSVTREGELCEKCLRRPDWTDTDPILSGSTYGAWEAARKHFPAAAAADYRPSIEERLVQLEERMKLPRGVVWPGSKAWTRTGTGGGSRERDESEGAEGDDA